MPSAHTHTRTLSPTTSGHACFPGILCRPSTNDPSTKPQTAENRGNKKLITIQKVWGLVLKWDWALLLRLELRPRCPLRIFIRENSRCRAEFAGQNVDPNFQMTAAARVTSQQLAPSGKTPGVSRSGSKHDPANDKAHKRHLCIQYVQELVTPIHMIGSTNFSVCSKRNFHCLPHEALVPLHGVSST